MLLTDKAEHLKEVKFVELSENELFVEDTSGYFGNKPVPGKKNTKLNHILKSEFDYLQYFQGIKNVKSAKQLNHIKRCFL